MILRPGWGRKNEAFRALRESHEAGFDLLENIEDDPDLKSLRGDERYEALMDELLDGSID